MLAALIISNSAYMQTKTGIEVLRENNFDILKGKRVGLITNPTGVDPQLKSTIDILHEAGEVNLVALYGPEHGVRGNFSAGDKVGGSVDPKTGIPVFSLYGKTRKPSKDMLSGIDVLVYDIQDIGARSYTYISTMGLAMEAAAEDNIEFVVLDRPDPLGGNRVEGGLVEDGYFSFVSQYPIPYIYGLTPGELANYLNEEGLLKGGGKCNLKVVEMENWLRNMAFADTQLPWVPTSPHIPRGNSAFFYSVTGIIGELDANSIGIGYTLPFEVFATTWLDGDKLAQRMNRFNLGGVIFRPISFKPYYMKNKGKEHAGVQIYITDYAKVNLTEIQFRLVQAAHELVPGSSIFENNPNRFDMFDKVVGSSRIREKFMENYRYEDIREAWEEPAKKFKREIKKYYLYK
ncbi:Protein YzbB [hydrothermal vent metagenome]|uniref:Protein YzbB n=1 Tax=hydrothermal vent metagenome TaxID=652676 RepID=A0A3B0UYB0_9ZZZZ